MMTLPGPEKAVIEIEKLRDYCLNANHPRGKHKARVFRSALGMTERDAEELREGIAREILEAECHRGTQDQYGERFEVDIVLTREGQEAALRTSWIVRRGEETPRLTSCYVK